MEFLYPNVLWIILIPSILLIYLIFTNQTNLQTVFQKEILEKLKAKESGLDISTRNILTFIALVLLVLALSRPVLLQKEKEIKQNLIPVIVALDVSKSMLSTDIYPNRLELAKKKIKEFLEITQNSAVGIVFFAKSTFILSPITKDFTTLSYMLDNIDSKGLNFDNGSNIINLLESSNQLLEDYDSKNIIILSDGGNNSNFEDEIEFSKQNNIKVYVLATATTKGAPIPTQNGYLTNNQGDIVTVSLNENIKELALNSGGGYLEFSVDNQDITAINNELLQRSKKEQMDIKKVKTYTELFYYPLSLGILFLFLSLFSIPKIKQNQISILLLTSILYTIPSYAGLLDFQTLNEAKKAYEEKNYKYASNQYKKVVSNVEGYYNLGNSLYKEGKYEEAIKAYEKVVTSDNKFEAKKLHNMGNSYVKLNNLKKAKEMYEHALEKNFDKQTKENLDRINKKMEEENKKQEQNDSKNQQNQKSKNQQEKEQKNKKNENKKDQKQNSKNQDKKNDKENKKTDNKKKSEEEKNQDKKSKEKNANTKKIEDSQKTISELEEKKWMEKLQNQKTPILLHKSKTKSEDKQSSSTPW